jgi:hypothetical protein
MPGNDIVDLMGRERAVSKDTLLAGDKIGGHTGKWYWEIAEARKFRVGKCNTIENQINFLTYVEPLRETANHHATRIQVSSVLHEYLVYVERTDTEMASLRSAPDPSRSR